MQISPKYIKWSSEIYKLNENYLGLFRKEIGVCLSFILLQPKGSQTCLLNEIMILQNQSNTLSNTKGYVTGEVFPMIQKIVRLTENAISPDKQTKPYKRGTLFIM